jgi:hypothetical protein
MVVRDVRKLTVQRIVQIMVDRCSQVAGKDQLVAEDVHSGREVRAADVVMPMAVAGRLFQAGLDYCRRRY